MPLRNKGAANTTRIELTTPGEWVDVKKRLGRGDELAIERATMAMLPPSAGTLGDLSADDAETAVKKIERASIDMIAIREVLEFIKLEVGVVAWSFEAETPLTKEALRDLDPADLELIDERLSEMYAERTDDDKQDLSAGGPTTS